MVVYKIECIVDGRFYIGASINAHKRHLEHFNDLRKRKHHNIFLQRAFDKYGEDSFTYKVLEEFQEEELMWKREEELKHDQEEHLLNPDSEDSTELGEVPQKAKQGAIGTSAYSVNKHYNIAYLGERKEKK